MIHGFTDTNGVFTSVDYPDESGTYLSGVNGAGDLVGFYCCNSTNQIAGFLYTGGVFTPINFPGAQDTVTFGINDAETLIGTYCDATCGIGSVANGFALSGGVFIPIKFPGAQYTGVFGIDDNGDLAGYSQSKLNPETESFIYFNSSRRFEGFTIGLESTANGINDSGEVVGEFEAYGGDYGFYGHLPGH